MTGLRAGIIALSCAAPLAAGKECKSNGTRPPTTVPRAQTMIHPSILHLVSVFHENNIRLGTGKHKASTPRHTSRSSRGKRLCGSTHFVLHALAFSDFRQACAPWRMAPLLQHRIAYLLGGTIGRIGFGSDQLGFECKEHLKNRLAQQGHIADDVSTENAGRDDRWSVTNQLASAIRTRRSSVVS